MARAKFKDIKAGRTLYAITVRIDPDGSKTAMPVETLRICSKPFREPKVSGVELLTARQWQFKLFTKCWFESQPKVTAMFCFVHGLDMPNKSAEVDTSFQTVAFTRRKEAERFGQDFVRSYVPTAEELAHASQREGRDALFAEHDDEAERDYERSVPHEDFA